MNWQSNPNVQKWALLILRVVVGVVFAAHGGQKLFQMGFGGVAGFFGSLGIPLPMAAAILVTLLEFLGGIALLLGIGTRYVSTLLAVDMLVAMVLVHAANGFFVSDGGYELTLLLLAGALYFLLSGPGTLSLDARIGGDPQAQTQRG